MLNEKKSSKIKIILNILLILCVYFFNVFIYYLIFGLYLKDTLSLFIAVAISSVLTLRFCVYKNIFYKFSVVLIPLLSSILVFSFSMATRNVIIHMQILEILKIIIISFFIFIFLYFSLKKYCIQLKKSYRSKIKKEYFILNKIHSNTQKFNHYSTIFKLEIFILVISTIWFYFFSKLVNIFILKILYPLTVILIIYLTLKIIKNKVGDNK